MTFGASARVLRLVDEIMKLDHEKVLKLDNPFHLFRLGLEDPTKGELTFAEASIALGIAQQRMRRE